MRLDLDTEIRFPSGERAGFLRKVVLDENNEVENVVVETDGLISRRVIVPVSLLYEGPGEVTYIKCTPDELDTLPDYVEERVPAIDENWEFHDTPSAVGEAFPATMYEPIIPIFETSNAGEDEIAITQGTEVWCIDGRWGIVDEVVVGDDGHVQSFVGRPNSHGTSLDYSYRVGREKRMRNRVTLNCSIADLPTYSLPLIDDNKAPEEE